MGADFFVSGTRHRILSYGIIYTFPKAVSCESFASASRSLAALALNNCRSLLSIVSAGNIAPGKPVIPNFFSCVDHGSLWGEISCAEAALTADISNNDNKKRLCIQLIFYHDAPVLKIT